MVAGTIEEFFPSIMDITLPPIEGNLQEIIPTEVEGGTHFLFDYGNVATGTTVEFAIGASFGEGRQNGDNFSNEIIMYEDGKMVGMDMANPVILTLESDFALEKNNMNTDDPKADEEVYFQLVLVNNGDAGATLTEITITDILPDGLVADQNYKVVGNDASENFPDISQDGLEGTWNGNTLTFYLPSYSGEKYVIDVYTKTDLRVTPGQTLTNTATWTANGEEQTSASANVTIYIDKVEGFVRKSGANNGTVGEMLQYEIFHGNRGTVAITDYRMTELVPTDFVLEKIKCFSSSNLFENYWIYVTTTAEPDTEILVGENLVGTTDVYNLLDYIPDSEKVNSVIWYAKEAKVTTSTSRLNLQGYVLETAEVDSILVNTATLTGTSTLGDESLTSEKETTLDGRSGLEVRKAIVSEQEFFYPLEEFTVSLTALARNYRTESPIFADILPPELVYLPGDEYYLYYNGFTRTLTDSRNDDYTGPTPALTVEHDFQSEGDTLLRFDFTGFNLEYRDVLMVFFTTAVAVGATGTFENVGYLGNPSDNGIVIGTAYLDTLDLDGDNYTDEEIAQSASVFGTILYTNEFSIEKWVKGPFQLEYAQEATTTSGGDVDYQLFVTDNQDVQLGNFEIVDILPHIGDTGVVLVEEERGSQFPVYLRGEPTVERVNLLENTTEIVTDVTVEYSTSYDPIRYNLLDETIGTGEWTTEIPENWEDVASVKVTTGEDFILEPYERLVVTLLATTPDGVPIGDIAYNSFGIKGDVIGSEETSTLLPTEPALVSVTIIGDDLGSIGQFVWDDLNENGIWDDGEPGINDVTVELYDSKGTLISTTETADHYTGEAGYYLFSDLTAGEYQVKFIPSSSDELTIQNLESPDGSRPDPTTGLTELFTLTEGEQITDMNAGILVEDDPRVQAINDLMESIALEEAGIQSILHGEGAKIQRAVELDFTNEELLAVNTSVESMVNRLTELETVLMNKLKKTLDMA